MITLKGIDFTNFSTIINMKVTDDQTDFVASNVYSLAQAKAIPECIPLAVYDGDTPAGFVMYAMDMDDREYWICRLMIDKPHQGKGYGGQAMQALLELIQKDSTHHLIYISFEPENHRAQALYESLGFVPDGRVCDGETVYRLEY